MEINDYVRTKEFGINRVEFFENDEPILKNGFTALQKDYKSSPNIIDLLEPMDLLFIDLSSDEWGGFVVPRIAETQNELDILIKRIKNKEIVLKGVLTKEQIEKMVYEINEL